MLHTIGPFSEELIQQAKECLAQNDHELDALTDSGRVNYHAARVMTLAKHLRIGLPQAEKLLKQVDTPPLESLQKMEEVKSHTHELQTDPYTILVDQLTVRYECFCKEQGLNPLITIPENLKNIIIFEFSKNGGLKHTVSLGMARFLLTSPAKIACREFFISASKEGPL